MRKIASLGHRRPVRAQQAERLGEADLAVTRDQHRGAGRPARRDLALHRRVSRFSAERERPISSGREAGRPAKACGNMSAMASPWRVDQLSRSRGSQDRQGPRAAGLGLLRGTDSRHVRPSRGFPRSARAARGPAAAEDARRGRGTGAPDRPRRRADAASESAEPRLDDLLGSAGHRQDDGRAADRQAGERRIRAGFGDPFRRRGTEEDLRRRARRAAPRAARRCCSSTKSIASTARSRIRSCPSWRTARSR